SAGRSTRSPHLRSTRARSATRRAVRIGSARTAGSTAVARSCTCTTTTTTTSTRPGPAMPGPITTVAVDANGADLGPAEVARGAAAAVEGGAVRVLLFAPAAGLGE